MFTNKFMNRMVNLKHLDAEGGAGGGSGIAAGEGGTGGSQQGVNIDYDKIADILAGKQKVNEENVLKGYFKQQGLSSEEMAAAITAFKEQRAQNTPDVAAIQQQASDAQAAAIKVQIERDALLMTAEIGVDLSTMPYVLRMADTKDCVVDGKVDGEKLKGALLKVLEDVPQLKANANENQNGGFKFGAGGNADNRDATEEALDKIFGVKKK